MGTQEVGEEAVWEETKLRGSLEEEESIDSNPSTLLIEPEAGQSTKAAYLTAAVAKVGQFRHCMLLALGFTIILGGILLIPSVISASKLPTASKNHNILYQPCGSTPEEARAAGCTFDIVSFCFLHPRCHDFKLAEEFAAIEPWQWFTERTNSSATIPREKVLSGDFEVSYVEYHYHVQHCMFMWRKLHRIMLSGKGKESIDSYIGSIDHTRHCGKMFLKAGYTALDTVNTRIRVKYPDCGIE